MPSISYSEIDDLSDAEIVARFKKRESLPDADHPFSKGRIVRITDDTVAKVSSDVDEEINEPSEPFVMNVVSRNTTIPVPRVRRLVKRDSEWDWIIVMDYIQGKQLSVVWPNMSQESKAQVATTLRGYIQQLRTISIPRRSIPGPPASDNVPRTVYCPSVLGHVRDYRGPFASYASLTAFFNERRQKMIRSGGATEANLPPFDNSLPLVLTHCDINPRNFIVGEDKKLWMIDWGWSGFYPEWWETVAMKTQAAQEEELRKRKDPDWRKIIPTACGEYNKQEDWLNKIGPSLDWI